MRYPIEVLALAGVSLFAAACSEAPSGGSPGGVSGGASGGAAPGAVGSVAGVPRFEDVIASSGITFQHRFLDSETGSVYRINPYDHGSGVYVADVNGDGLDDVYLLNFLGPNGLYLNRGDMRFEDVTAASGVAVARALCVGAAFGDADGDGDADLFVTTYRGGNHMFRNDGTGVFAEITADVGLEHSGHSSAATWFDYDLDGDLDLYLCNIGKFTTETISHEADYFYAGVELPFARLAEAPDNRVPGERDILYRNDGGRFTDVTEAAGLAASAEWNGDVAVADVDLDGWPDVYTSNMFGTNHLFRNRGDGTFEEITDTALRRTSWGGMGARFFDANGDAYPDLYVVDMHSDMWVASDAPEKVTDPTAKYNNVLGGAVGGGFAITGPEQSQATKALFGNTFFENNGDGTFTERSAAAGLENWWPWGVTAGDYNNDGHVDLFVPSGMGYPYFYWPNHLYVNAGDGTFAEVAAAAGIEPPARGTAVAGAEIRGEPFMRSSRTAATADFDRDGDLDIIVNNFNHEPYLFENQASGGHALQVRLRGTTSNRDAIGARVTVVTPERTYHRTCTGAAGYLSQSSLVVHVGLGAAAVVERVEVLWPGATEPQVVSTPPLNEVVEIVQE